MKITLNIHMIDTDEESNIIAVKEFNTLFLKDNLACISNMLLELGINQHIYITLLPSDLEMSKIKEGDYCIEVNSDGLVGKPFKADNITISMQSNKQFEKIIATTNTSLIIKSLNIKEIPRSFIQDYINEYNKNKNNYYY